MAKAKTRARGMNPPKAGAAPQGTDRTPAQEKEYRKVLSKMQEGEQQGKKFSLQLAHVRGGHAWRLLSPNNRTTYGTNHVNDIADDLNIKRLTMTQCIKFFRGVKRAQLDELMSMDQPPSWRMMAQWTSIKEPEKRERALKDIMNGKLTNNGFDEKLRDIVGRGAPRKRRPTDPAEAFRKISKEVVSVAEMLDRWVPEAAKSIPKIGDVMSRKATKKLVSAAMKDMQQMKKKLEAALAACAKIVE